MHTVQRGVQHLKDTRAVPVGLALVRVGDDPASSVYVAHKQKACARVGIRSFLHHCPASASAGDIRTILHALNADPLVHGILLQLPLPSGLDPLPLVDAIAPEKDVDGLTARVQARLFRGHPSVVPCTPQGCILLLRQVLPSLKGVRVAVVGRSLVVGRPLASLLTLLDATVTHIHSASGPLEDLLPQADVIVSATGHPGLIRGHHVREGAVVVDVGIHRVHGNDGSTRLTGDVVAAEVAPKARAITPVPGGVGPMTVACLLANTLRQAEQASLQASD